MKTLRGGKKREKDDTEKERYVGKPRKALWSPQNRGCHALLVEAFLESLVTQDSGLRKLSATFPYRYVLLSFQEKYMVILENFENRNK